MDSPFGRPAITTERIVGRSLGRAIATAVEMGPAERRRRARGLRSAVARNPIEAWVRAQVEDLERMGR